jgi:Flp pilus assembly protein TadG
MKRRYVRSESGTSMVEFALVLPVFMFLLIGMIETGRYVRMAILASHAARAAVQYGAQSTFTAIDTAGMINAATQDGQNLPNWTVRPTHFCTNNGAVATCPTGEPSSTTAYYVQVVVTGTFTSLLNYPGIQNSELITSTAVMRVGSQ